MTDLSDSEDEPDDNNNSDYSIQPHILDRIRSQSRWMDKLSPLRDSPSLPLVLYKPIIPLDTSKPEYVVEEVEDEPSVAENIIMQPEVDDTDSMDVDP